MERFLRKKLWKGEFTNVSRERSAIMRAIKGKHNKTTDEQLRMLLVRRGVSGWKMHPKNIAGKPDIYFPSKKRRYLSTVVFGTVVLSVVTFQKLEGHFGQPRSREIKSETKKRIVN